jgi:CRISPR-associated protein Cas1
MIKRTLFFSSPLYLSIENQQLLVTNKKTAEIKRVTVEDLGFVVLDHPQLSFSLAVIQHLAANNVAVVFCDHKHIPVSMLLHLDTHQVQTERFHHQITASLPLKKQLWQQTIKSKINNQASMLEYAGKSPDALRHISTKVLSGDPANEEAQAARRYWRQLFTGSFTRERFGHHPNPWLNYGYAIVRAAIARSLSGSGLLPTLGIHHKNRYNSYCLADDIMEPYRPYVDQVVWNLHQEHAQEELTADIKMELLRILASDVRVGNQTRPMMVAMTETSSSLAECFSGERKTLKYPKL